MVTTAATLLDAARRRDTDRVVEIARQSALTPGDHVVAAVRILVRNGDHRALHALQENGVCDAMQDADGTTPLIWAVQQGDLTALKIFLRSARNVDTTDLQGWSALFHGAVAQDLPVVQALLGAGASVALRDWKGRTPADVARYRIVQFHFPMLGPAGGMWPTIRSTAVRSLLESQAGRP